MKKITSVLILISILFSMSVISFADPEFQYEKLGTATINVVDENEVSNIIESVLGQYDVRDIDVAVMYCYTATGEVVSRNAGQWYDGCGLCVIPGMMGILNCDDKDLVTKIDNTIGIELAMQESLSNSRNRYGLLAIDAMYGSWKDFRTEELKLINKENIDLPKNYYDDATYTSALINEYMFDIFNSSEHYAKILDYMKQANSGEYLKSGQKANQYTIAQKGGVDENRATVTGIIYTENPIIVTVLTRNIGYYNANRIFGELADKLIEYTETTADKTFEEVTAPVPETVEVIEPLDDPIIEPENVTEEVTIIESELALQNLDDDNTDEVVAIETTANGAEEPTVNVVEATPVVVTPTPAIEETVPPTLEPIIENVIETPEITENVNSETEALQTENSEVEEITEEMTQEMLEEELQRKAEAEEARRLEAEAIDVVGINKTLDDYTAVVFCAAVVLLFIVFIIIKVVKMIRG